ncbi:phr [Symbiodinium natans]|uniref:Phr protein n=1 Tax=Symbiodinium natans TaxID=878477 RepID=A0A812H5U8_9DINO|nr:phr [Symbiodinium natans]
MLRSRDQRAHDNWALIKAQDLALEKKASLHVCFCLVPKFLDATLRHFDFMLQGLAAGSAIASGSLRQYSVDRVRNH